MVIARQPDRERFYQLVAELKRRGTPISGLGIQAHEPREEWFSPEKVRTTLDRLGELGYPLHITEYIPQSGGKPITGGWREGTWTEETQAEFAEQFYRLCFGHPAVVSINWWGLSDRQIWLPGGGLLRRLRAQAGLHAAEGPDSPAMADQPHREDRRKGPGYVPGLLWSI